MTLSEYLGLGKKRIELQSPSQMGAAMSSISVNTCREPQAKRSSGMPKDAASQIVCTPSTSLVISELWFVVGKSKLLQLRSD